MIDISRKKGRQRILENRGIASPSSSLALPKPVTTACVSACLCKYPLVLREPGALVLGSPQLAAVWFGRTGCSCFSGILCLVSRLATSVASYIHPKSRNAAQSGGVSSSKWLFMKRTAITDQDREPRRNWSLEVIF